MCPVCASAPALHWSEQCGNDAASTTDLRRQRHHRVAVLAELLRDYAVSVRIAPGPAGYVLSDRKGSSRVVGSAGELWPTIDVLAPRSPDPLDSTLLDGIEDRTAPAGPSAGIGLPMPSRRQPFTVVLDGRLDWVAFALWLDLLLHRHGSESLYVEEPLEHLGTGPVAIHGVEHLDCALVRRSLLAFQRLGSRN